MLKKARIPHNVLNAKNHTQEAEIIKDAGKLGVVTIATNMAGRGVDIKIEDSVRELGGLFIIGTKRTNHGGLIMNFADASGRQGDPGASQFYLSLEDSLLKIFGSDKIKGVMEKLGLKDGEHIESGFITRSIENAQKKVENLHFESRKHILEYDDVANEQRKLIYQFRNRLLDENYDLSHKIAEDREFAVDNILGNLTDLESGSVEDFDALQSQIAEFFGVVLQNIAQDLNLNDLKEQILAQIASDYKSKMSVLDAEQRGEIERIIYLQVLDSAWREHLYVMDNLKTGIGLRGYNQKEPAHRV